MAKVRRWAVRVDFGYALFVGSKPYRKGTGWVCHRGQIVGLMDPRLFEDFFPACCHSDPQIKPVEIEFKDEA